jgi:hypothetical protein
MFYVLSGIFLILCFIVSVLSINAVNAGSLRQIVPVMCFALAFQVS